MQHATFYRLNTGFYVLPYTIHGVCVHLSALVFTLGVFSLSRNVLGGHRITWPRELHLRKDFGP